MNALLLAAVLSTCVPARWDAPDAAALSLLDGTPISCLLMEEPAWKPDVIEAARARRLGLLAVAANDAAAQRAAALGFDAIVAEGNTQVSAGPKPVVRLLARAKMDLARPGEIAGTNQGLWPGIHVEKDGGVVAAPTGAPWIDTNVGFLRFVKASVPATTAVWIANRPPENEVLSGRRYVQALADAAMTGARWVLAIDKGLQRLLLDRDARALASWQQIVSALSFYERNAEYAQWPEASQLALLQDGESGALYSGGFMDMMGARHIPAVILPTGKLLATTPEGVRLLLNIAPASLSEEQKERVKGVARSGAMVVNGPPGWKLALADGSAITFSKEQVKQLDEAWREINGLVGRRNFGVRVFGAPGMLSSLKRSPDGKRLAIHLVNYTDYPVEQISLHLEGKWSRATLLTPQGKRAGDLYPMEEGTGVDVDKVVDVAIVVVE